jgi:hypothetical protein
MKPETMKIEGRTRAFECARLNLRWLRTIDEMQRRFESEPDNPGNDEEAIQMVMKAVLASMLTVDPSMKLETVEEEFDKITIFAAYRDLMQFSHIPPKGKPGEAQSP